MKNRIQLSVVVRSLLALAFILVIHVSARAQYTILAMEKPKMGATATAQTPDAESAKDPTKNASMIVESGGDTAVHMESMMRRHEDLMAEMKTQDAELTAQVAKMNRAPKDRKMELLAAIVTRLVEQRTSMNTRMAAMRGDWNTDTQTGGDPMTHHATTKGMDEKSESPAKRGQ